MCGRYNLRTNQRGLFDEFGLPAAPDFPPRYNIAPTQNVPIIRADEGMQEWAIVRWGLVPSWTKELKGPPLINARADTVATKPSFRAAFKKRRCLVPADGYYEWQATSGTKQPFLIHMADDKPFAFAGLWESWHGGQATLESCAIITTDANELTRTIHDRMPVILAPKDWSAWLAPATEFTILQELLRPFPSERMGTVAIRSLVNNPKNDGPECVQPV